MIYYILLYIIYDVSDLAESLSPAEAAQREDGDSSTEEGARPRTKEEKGEAAGDIHADGF